MEGLSSEEQIVASIRQIMRAVDLHSRRLVEVCGLTGPQLAVLREAARLEPAAAGVLARAVHLSQGTVSGILARLETRRLVRRRRHPADRRAVEVHVTPEGRRVLDGAPSLLQDRFRLELSRLEQWERLLILSTLQRVAALMGAEDLDAAPHLISDTVNLSDGGRPAHGGEETADGATGPLAADKGR